MSDYETLMIILTIANLTKYLFCSYLVMSK